MRTTAQVAVPQPVDAVWAVLTDLDGVLASLPAAALTRDGDAVSGTLKCKLGTTQITYRINVRAETGQPERHSAVLTLSGKEARGSGAIDGTVMVALRDEPPGTHLEVVGDLEVSGRAESAGEGDWAKVLQSLIAGLLPSTATARSASRRPPATRPPAPPAPPAPAAAAPAPARPPLAVAPSLSETRPASSGRSRTTLPLGFGIAAVGLLLLLRAIRRHRRG